MEKPCAIAMVISLLLVGIMGGCRGYSTPNPPIHLNRNMYTQEKGKAYRVSDFFDDGQVMRQPLAHTVARSQLKEDEHFFFGTIDGKPATSFPKEITLDEAFIKRGQAVFNRVCAACHSPEGDGNGLVGKRLIVKPTSLHSDYMYSLPPGHFLQVISNGIRTMQGYEHMLSVEDRWATVAYIRSLQMSQDIDGEWIKRSASWWTQR